VNEDQFAMISFIITDRRSKDGQWFPTGSNKQQHGLFATRKAHSLTISNDADYARKCEKRRFLDKVYPPGMLRFCLQIGRNWQKLATIIARNN
jgi:hypothetical protein